MHFVRLGRTTLNLAYCIAADEDDAEPGTLLVECYPGKVRKLRGADAERLRLILAHLDASPPARPDGGAGGVRRPRRVSIREVPPDPAAPPAPVSRKRRREG